MPSSIFRETRQLVGTGGKREQIYLDAIEGHLRHAQGRPTLAVEPLQRAVAYARMKGNGSLGRSAAYFLVRALVSLDRDDAATLITNQVEEQWGPAPELRSALHLRATARLPQSDAALRPS
jgi:hypothetical protein